MTAGMRDRHSAPASEEEVRRELQLCRFCNSPAAGRFALSRGCVAFPEDREQLLCLHHWCRATPLGDMVLVEDLRRADGEGAFGLGGPPP
jgi:hypothetical protein